MHTRIVFVDARINDFRSVVDFKPGSHECPDVFSRFSVCQIYAIIVHSGPHPGLLESIGGTNLVAYYSTTVSGIPDPLLGKHPKSKRLYSHIQRKCEDWPFLSRDQESIGRKAQTCLF